jgi:hypothetical protein
MIDTAQMPEDDHSSADGSPANETVAPAPASETASTSVGRAGARAANPGATKAATPLKPVVPASVKPGVTVTAKQPGPPTPPPPPFKALPSMPLSMMNSPGATSSGNFKNRIEPDESEDDFARATAELKPLPRRNRSFAGRLLSGLLGRSKTASFDTDRHVAFDGYRSEQHDEKLERDRRYGTVYTVTEYENAYLVRLELPRRMPSSSLRQVWHLGEARPEYDLTIELGHKVLSIRGRLRGEAPRRLAYVSPSFPSGFLTRIEFAEPVGQIIYRTRESLVEVIGYKTAQINTGEGIPKNKSMTAVTE